MRFTRVFVYILLLSAACKKENLVYNARVTMLNAVPDAPGFEVYASGNKLDAPAVFGQPDYYLSVPAVTDSVKWKISNHTGFDSSFVTDFPNNNDFTLLFYDSASRYGSYLVKDHWQQPASTKQGYIRFFPMIIDANALKLTNDTGKVLIGSRKFADFKTGFSPFTAIDSFSTNLRLYNDNVLIDSLPGAILLPGKSYTLYAFGILNATGDKRPKMILQEHK